MEFSPTFWGENQKGMQAAQSIKEKDIEKAKLIWQEAKQNAAEAMLELQNLNVHKQVQGKIGDFAAYVKCLLTGTEFWNFFALRAEYNAEPHLGYLATIMLKQYLENTPKQLTAGQWHLPLIKPEEQGLSNEVKLVKSAARCARTSYNNFYGKDDYQADLKLFEMLKSCGHWSPMEHQAQACYQERSDSNFSSSWKQHRKLLEIYTPIDWNQRNDQTM